jgi:hypothetical protein
VAKQFEYCETCKAQKEVRNVEELPDGKKLKMLECGHKVSQIVVVVNEKIGISENVGVDNTKGPC